MGTIIKEGAAAKQLAGYSHIEFPMVSRMSSVPFIRA